MLRHFALALFSFALAGIAATTANAGSLTPPGAPAPTMRTIEQLKPSWDKIIPAAQRFVDALGGAAVLDKETGLVWAKTPDSTKRDWLTALNYVTSMTLGGRKGWRLPTVEELASLVDTTSTSPALPTGHTFLNVMSSNYYWSSTADAGNSSSAYSIYINAGDMVSYPKSSPFGTWAVRGGQ